MSKLTRTFITTDDTGRTYEMDGKDSPGRPQLWFVEIKMEIVESTGYHRGTGTGKGFYVERSTLEKVGMIGHRIVTPKPGPVQDAQDEVRETLEKLLSLVGIYPEH